MNRRDFVKWISLLPLFAAAGKRRRRVIAGYFQGDFGVSLNFYSFNTMLNNWLRHRPNPITTLEVIDFAADHGFDAVDITAYYIPGYVNFAMPTDFAEIDAYVARITQRCADLGLPVSGTGVLNDFATTDQDSRELDVQRVNYWIEVAANMGAPVMRVFSGPVPEGYEDRWDDTAIWMADCLNRVAEHGKQFGVKVGVQNHGDSLANADETIRLVQMVNHDNLGVIDDTGYFRPPNSPSGADYDWYTDIAAVLPYAVNFQVKRKPGGAEDSVLMDLPRLFRLVRASSYRGYLPIEYLVARGEPYDPIVQVPELLSQVRDALEETKDCCA